MKKNLIVVATLALIMVMMLSMVGCTSITFSSITKVKSHKDIEKVSIVQNTDVTDGLVIGDTTKDYTAEKDIMTVFNILSKADYRVDKADNYDVPEYEIRIYLKGKSGYIRYEWDKAFSGSEDFDGKIKAGRYSMDSAHDALAKIKKLFFRD